MTTNEQLSANDEQTELSHMELDTKAAIHQSILKLISLAKRDIIIVLENLHQNIDERDISQALLSFINASPKREVIILLNNLSDQYASSHTLIKLAQRLSRVTFRQASNLIEPPIKATDYLFISDRKHFLRIDHIEQNHAWLHLNHAARASQYSERIMQQWHIAHEVREFKQFYYNC